MKKSTVARSGTPSTTPVNLVLGWWGFCFLLYSIGWPILYNQTNYWRVLLLVLVSAYALYAGFRWGSSRAQPAPSTRREGGGTSRLMIFGLLVSLTLFVPTAQAYSGLGIGQLTVAVEDQSAAYQQATDVISQGSGGRSSLLLINTIFAPVTIGVIPYFTMLAVETKRARHRMLAAASIAPPLVLSLLTGRTQALGVVALVCAASVLVAVFRGSGRLDGSTVGKIASLAVALFSLIAWRKRERMGGQFSCQPGQVNCSESASSVSDSISTVASYATQGFEGLGRSLNGHWSFGGGFAHSPALDNFARTFFQTTDSRDTITKQLYQFGWDETGFWSSGWSQIANDVPWLLIPFLLLFVGVVTGQSWTEAVQTGHWLPVTVFAYLFLGLAFMPQNFQLGASGPTYVGFIVLTTIFVKRALKF